VETTRADDLFRDFRRFFGRFFRHSCEGKRRPLTRCQCPGCTPVHRCFGASIPYNFRTSAFWRVTRTLTYCKNLRPLPDSNRCCRRERAVSWASRRRGRGVTGKYRSMAARSSTTAMVELFSEIQKLQGLVGLQAADDRDYRLKVVALFAGDAHLLA